MALKGMRLSLSERGKTTDYATALDRALDSSAMIQELGEKFEADKATLEERIQRIWNISIPDAQKEGLIAEIQRKISELQQQYEQDVMEEQQRIEQSMENITVQMEDAAASLDDEAADFKSMKIEGATDVDVASTGNAIAEESRLLREQKSEAQQKMDMLRETLENQRSSIRNRPN